jgi:LPXTG-motif cell wall-anchored protein
VPPMHLLFLLLAGVLGIAALLFFLKKRKS